MKRIGLLTMALVLALGSLGIAYAAWTDEVTIEGSVDTGTVEMEIHYYSSTWVYKELATHEIVVHYDYYGWEQDPLAGDPAYELIAWSLAEPGSGDYDVHVTYQNVFPLDIGDGFITDLYIQYQGSVPGRISAEIVDGNLPDEIEVLFTYWGYDPDWGQVEEGYQLHQGDWVNIYMPLVLPQDNTLMGLDDLWFTARIVVTQWNEY